MKPFPSPSAIKSIVLVHVSHVEGFMRLLMKPRNALPWCLEDKVKLRIHLKYFSRTLPILGLFALPGGALLVPALSWFLDRRKDKARRLEIAATAIRAAAQKDSQSVGTE